MTLVVTKRCQKVVVSPGESQLIHVNICLQFFKNFLPGTGLLYRNCTAILPYLTLDEFNEDQNNEVFNDTADENIDGPVSCKDFVSTNISESTDENIVYKGLPQKKIIKEKEFGEPCRNILNEIRSLPFLLGDNEDLISETYQLLNL